MRALVLIPEGFTTGKTPKIISRRSPCGASISPGVRVLYAGRGPGWGHGEAWVIDFERWDPRRRGPESEKCVVKPLKSLAKVSNPPAAGKAVIYA